MNLSPGGSVSWKWLTFLYSIRDMWIPAFFKNIFLAGMRSTQSSESMNNFCNNVVNKKLSLVEFYAQFESAMEEQRENELIFDHTILYKKPVLKMKIAIERQMARI